MLVKTPSEPNMKRKKPVNLYALNCLRAVFVWSDSSTVGRGMGKKSPTNQLR